MKKSIIVKGILKKGLAGLKFTLATLPVVFTVGGIVSLAVGGIGFAVKTNQAVEEYSKTETFIQRQADDIAYIESTYEKKNISQSVYEKYMKKFNSDGYVKEVMEADEEYYSELKKEKEPYKLAITWGGAAAISGIGLGLLYFATEWGENLFYFAEEDWNYLNNAIYEDKKREKETGSLEVEI